jgi:hypothetical protein
MPLAVSRVPFAWLASIRPEPNGDLKRLTRRVNWRAKEPDLACFDGRLGALPRHAQAALRCAVVLAFAAATRGLRNTSTSS